VASRIEDYALIGDCQTAALVARDGSIDWLCLPRFDSPACFAALLGTPDHGRWLLAPAGAHKSVRRAYRDGSLVLDTTFETDGGTVVVTDCMRLRDSAPRLVRVVHGLRGHVEILTELVIRFDYGSVIPWVRRTPDGGIRAIAGPHSLRVHCDVPLKGENMTTVASFDVVEGQSVAFVMSWHPSHVEEPDNVDALAVVAETERAWREWASQCTYRGPWRDVVLRSLVTLKALTHAATGGIAAAPTTSLPERLGGARNWDYRFSWVRDATFTLLAMVHNGFHEEARAWREWLLRAVAGDPSEMQIMYAIDGDRRLEEQEIPWLPGYEGSRPVRIGNAAYRQRQLDIYGEIMDALYQCHRFGIPSSDDAWDVRKKILEFLEGCWSRPDEGIWEVRGPQRQFTHSKVMAWVAFDRAVRRVERVPGSGPVEKWRDVRDRIREDVCRNGYDSEVGSFVQYYGGKELDASLLLIPLVGFLPVTDERVRGTVHAIEARLFQNGFVRRYDSTRKVDGLPEGEGAFLPCSFWLADNWCLLGRHDEARDLFERLVSVSNDVGLLSEEYDPHSARLVGNFPQAFSHVALVNSALHMCQQRATRPPP
jgi:GH15 family glucan-1,4-alpha-glucosidase